MPGKDWQSQPDGRGALLGTTWDGRLVCPKGYSKSLVSLGLFCSGSCFPADNSIRLNADLV